MFSFPKLRVAPYCWNLMSSRLILLNSGQKINYNRAIATNGHFKLMNNTCMNKINYILLHFDFLPNDFVEPKTSHDFSMYWTLCYILWGTIYINGISYICCLVPSHHYFPAGRTFRQRSHLSQQNRATSRFIIIWCEYFEIKTFLLLKF